MTAPLALVVLVLVTAPRLRAQEGQRARSLSLNGPWQFALGPGHEHAETQAGQAILVWKPVTLPGPFVPWSQDFVTNTAFVWARRSFELTAEQARSLAVLRWNRIGLGAVAFVNGREVGHNEPTGPYQVIVPSGVLLFCQLGLQDRLSPEAPTHGPVAERVLLNLLAW